MVGNAHPTNYHCSMFTCDLQVPSGYQTQSADTDIEAELVQFALWRQMSSGQKEALFRRVVRRVPVLIWQAVRQQFPDAPMQELRYAYVRKRWGETGAKLLAEIQYSGGLMLEDPIWLARKIAGIFSSLDIPYYLGGSVASSLQGEVRYTEDLDLVAHIQPAQVRGLVERLSGEFYISEVAVEDAMSGRCLSFNIIHLETTEKADIFVMRDDAFSRSQMKRRSLHVGDGDIEGALYLCSPEDTILQKLLWFKMTARESQKQWRDILGVLKLQGKALDFDYLREWGERLAVLVDLERAFVEAGI